MEVLGKGGRGEEREGGRNAGEAGKLEEPSDAKFLGDLHSAYV